MVPVNSASSRAGVQSRAEGETKSPNLTDAVNGTGPEVALSQGVSLAAGAVLPEADGAAGIGSGRGSSASRLTGLSAADIKTIDDKFQRVLDTVHENRPGDDLEIIRKAWEFCLEK